MPNYFYGATSLTGGGAGALDAIPSADLQDEDGAVAITDDEGALLYHYDSSSSAAESSPNIIAPDDIGANSGRWVLQSNLIVDGNLIFHNTTHEDTDYGRESEIRFKGEQSGGEKSTLAIFQVAHDGTGDDQKGIVTLKVNDGNDNDAPIAVITIDSSGRIGIGTVSPTVKLAVEHDTRSTVRVKSGTRYVLVDCWAGDLNYQTSSGADYIFGTADLKHLRLYTNNTEKMRIQSNGNVGIGTITPGGLLDLSPGTTGGFHSDAVEATVNITAAHTCTIQANIPSGAKILGCQLRVDTALAAGETWNAQYVTGATQVICTAQAVAQNTKVNKFFDENAATAITSAETDITIQRSSNPGVDVFTAQGTIRAIVYYQGFTAMGNA